MDCTVHCTKSYAIECAAGLCIKEENTNISLFNWIKAFLGLHVINYSFCFSITAFLVCLAVHLTGFTNEAIFK